MSITSSDGLELCIDERRSGILLNPAHPLNGVDFVEFRRDPLALPGRRLVLDLVFLKAAPALALGDLTIFGGVRIVDLAVTGFEADAGDARIVHLFVDREGDFSLYVLAVDHPDIDPERSEIAFGFKASCPSELDCKPADDCLPDLRDEPALDYMAKDYQSFRRLLVDLIADRNPGWQERLPADLGMTLVELMAYAGDYLSYYQDAGPGTESFLDTCLHRISAARHARLIDYDMSDGRNAGTYVHFVAAAGAPATVPAGTPLMSRIGVPLLGAMTPPGTVIAGVDFDADPALAGVKVFETIASVTINADNNEIRIHQWGDAECCLARGTTSTFLYSISPAGTAIRPPLGAGDYLLFEEVASPVTGLPADADHGHRHVVLIETVADTEDAVFTDAVGAGLTPRLNPADPALPLLKVTWTRGTALAFPLCLSAMTARGVPVDPVSVARGNIAAADHGRTVTRDTDLGTLAFPDPGAGRWPIPLLALPDAPLTQTPDGPAAQLLLNFPGEPDQESWLPAPSLLDSGPFDQRFVAEVDNGGVATLRFGDDMYGRRPLDAARAVARYRIGNGTAGNCGSDTLVHVVATGAAGAAIVAIRQPLPATGGLDPETIEHVRQIAPEAFRAVQFRAVTEADWEEIALRHQDIAAAKASFHWTGSWYTVFIAVHPVDAEHLRRLPGAGAELQADFAALLKAYFTRFKLAGYDLQIRAAIYVPLEIDIRLCIGTGYFRGDVLAEVQQVLSNRRLPDGRRGFFDPLSFGFGGAVYLSRLYAAVEAVEGVNSAEVTLFKRYWEVARDELQRGLIGIGSFEIARLDNDPNFPENGVLRLVAVGGL